MVLRNLSPLFFGKKAEKQLFSLPDCVIIQKKTDKTASGYAIIRRKEELFMEPTHRFRSALSGFNRQDVVQYIEYLNAKHTAQLNQLNSEIEFLRQQLDRQAPQQDTAVIEELEARCAQLEQERDAALEGQAKTPTEAELEAYRRAERSEQIYRQATATLADATARVDETAVQIAAVADSVKAQLDQLQTAVENSKASLTDAAAVMDGIRPEDTEE